MLIGELLNKLNKVKKQDDGSFLASCPAHKDKTPSLHLSQADDRILLKCMAGCATESICQSLGITLADLFTETKEIPKTIAATYDYHDEQGDLLFQVVRYHPKSFGQRHKNGSGEWVWNTQGIRKVLYHLPEILKEQDIIYLVEGEKDADKLWEYGQVATTSPGGANAWKPEYAEFLKGKRVIIIPDNDEAGHAYARAVSKSLQGKARELKCIMLPELIKDFSDWIENGNDIAELSSLEQDISTLFSSQAPIYKREEEAIIWAKNLAGQSLLFKAESIHQERTGIHARISLELDYQRLAWSLFNIEKSEDRVRLANQALSRLKVADYNKEDLQRDLDLFCGGLWNFQVSTFVPEMVQGDDNETPPQFYLFPYILAGGGTILFAAPGKGKSNTALLWAQSINTGTSKLFKVEKVPVIFINLERSQLSLKRRLANINTALGLPAQQPLLMLNARGKSLLNILPAMRKAIKQYSVKMIVLDSISRAGYGKMTEDAPVNSIIDALSGLCDSWLALAHSPRSSDEHLYGSVMFEAGADIVIQLRSQVSDNKLGIGYEITKSNDLPAYPQQVFAFEFEEWRLTNVRKANPYEFPEIEVKSKTSMLEATQDFISNQDSGDASATEIEEALGYNRVNISKVLNHSGKFIKTRKVKTSQYFGVKVV